MHNPVYAWENNDGKMPLSGPLDGPPALMLNRTPVNERDNIVQ